jgi:Carboxypeptidase regulatory-like domain
MFALRTRPHGFTIVEALIVIAIGVTMFGSLLVTFEYAFELLLHSKARTTALSIATDRMEYFRSLPYDDVGTISGIPPGTIPQNSTTTLNKINFSERILVEYVDDPADGLLTATTTDSNGIPADYKRVKIEMSWTIKGETRSIALVSNIVPRSIETTDGGGTIRVNVLNADASPLFGAQVRLLNNTTTTTIDVTKNTDVSGTALFSGAPAASNYEVIVTAPGYSTDRTYVANVANPNPITAPFSLLEADISTVTFQIGELSDMDITTYSSITDIGDTEDFTGSAGVATSSGTEVASGVLRLEQSAGVYDATGQAKLTTLTPSPLEAWGAVTVAATTPSNTQYEVQLFTVSSSTYTLIPDSDIPGNAAGFTGPVIDISSLDAGAFPSIAVGITMQTGDTSVSPSIDEIGVYYRESSTARTGVALSLHGNKLIGTDLSANPIYKTALSGTTDGSGELSFTNVEFDSYTFTIPNSLEVTTACRALPHLQQAGIDSSLDIVLRSSVDESLRTTVLSPTGDPIPGVSVTLSRSGFSATADTNLCGQTFMHSGVVLESDYDLVVSKPGYTTQNISTFTINGNTDTVITLIPQ